MSDMTKERQKTHGDFAENARLSQSLKAIFFGAAGYQHLTLVQLEALDMIALKLSRILSGHAMHSDHWKDISGYAELAVQEIELGMADAPGAKTT